MAQTIDIKFIVETSEEQYYEKVCKCGFVNNFDAPNCRIKYEDNVRALVTYLNVVQCIPFKRIAELISDLSGRKISEGTIQNILKENSDKSDSAYEEIRRLELNSLFELPLNEKDFLLQMAYNSFLFCIFASTLFVLMDSWVNLSVKRTFMNVIFGC